MTGQTWTIILGIATLIGGASAIWFFGEKLWRFFFGSSDASHLDGAGGAAVRGGSASNIEVQNLDGGEMRGGSGGTGGRGGDAIVVSEGGGITIINRGTIAGGDAGN